MNRSSTVCRRCGRPLTSEKSIRAGIGPTCAKQEVNAPIQLDAFPLEEWPDNNPLPPDNEFWVFELVDGEPRTNVPRVAIKHSPTGFAWGYNGSGPSDLALNLLAVLLPVGKKHGSTKVGKHGDRVSISASYLYQKFKQEFIATLPEQGGKIERKKVDEWIWQNLPPLGEIDGLY